MIRKLYKNIILRKDRVRFLRIKMLFLMELYVIHTVGNVSTIWHVLIKILRSDCFGLQVKQKCLFQEGEHDIAV